MRGSVTIGRIAGVPIRVHWSFSLLVAYVLISYSGAPRSELLASLVWIVALFACVTLHELSHCAVARRRGLEVRDIILLPIGGVSQIMGMQGSAPRTERDVAIAGPLASLGLAGAFALVAAVTGGHLWPPSLFTGSWFARLAWLNLVLAAFNLLPALPMDGGRVLRATLALRRDNVWATRIASAVAQVVGAVMIGIGLVSDFWLVLIGVFVLLGATSERRAANVQASFSGLHIGDLMTSEPTVVPAEVSVHELATWLSMFPGRAVPVTDGGRVAGIVASSDLTGASPWATVGTVCDRRSPLLEASQPAFPQAFEAFASSDRDQLVVVYGEHPIGVLYRATVDALAAARGRASWTGPTRWGANAA
jgi:Zn-dependent protease